MPYLQLPDNSYYSVPDGISYDDAMAQAKAKHPDAFGIQQHSGILAQIPKGAQEFGSQAMTGIRSLFGNAPEAAQQGLDYQQGLDQKTKSLSWQDVQDAYNSPQGGIMPAIGKGAQFAGEQLANMAPAMGTSMATARLGALAGSAVMPGAGTLIGGGIGAIAPFVLQQLGSNVEQQQQQTPGQINVGGAAAAAVPQAAVGMAAHFIPFGKQIVGSMFGGAIKEALQAGDKAAAESLARETLMQSAAKGTLYNAGVQAPAMVVQDMLGRLQSGQDLTSDDALASYGQAAATGAVLSPLGAVGRISDAGAARTGAAKTAAANQAADQQAAAAADEQAKSQPDYLLQLEQQYNDAKAQRDTIAGQIKGIKEQLNAPDVGVGEKRDLIQQRKELALQLDTAKNQFNPLAAEYAKRQDAIAAAKEQQRVAGMTPEEYAYGLPPEEPGGLNQATMADQPPPAAPAAPAAPSPVSDYLSQFVSPMARMTGEDPAGMLLGQGNDPRQLIDVMSRNPMLSNMVIKGKDLFPGAPDKPTSDAWKTSLKQALADRKQGAVVDKNPSLRPLSAQLGEQPEQEASDYQLQQQVTQQHAQQLEDQDRAQLGQQMGMQREQAARQSALQQQVADTQAAQQARAQQAEAATARVIPQVEQNVRNFYTDKPELTEAVDSGQLTPAVAKTLKLDGVTDPLDLTNPAHAAVALPKIEARIQDLNDQKQSVLANDKVQLTDQDGNLTKNGQDMQRVEAQLQELQRLKTHAQGVSDPNDAALQGALERATPQRTPSIDVGLPQGLQPQQYGARAKEMAGQHESLMMDLQSQIDELKSGQFFKAPESGLPPRDVAHAMQMEQTLTRKVQEARAAVITNMLQEAAARREAKGLPGLTRTEALRAALDVRGAIDALMDKARGTDDSATTFVHAPSKDKITTDSYGHKWVMKGGKSISEQQLRARNDPTYADVRLQGKYGDVVKRANEVIEKARADLAQPPTAKGAVRKGEFQLAPQTEARTQAIEARAAGAQLPAGELQDNRRIHDTVNRIDQVNSLPATPEMGMTRALLEKAKQFMTGMTRVDARDEEGRPLSISLTSAKAGKELMDNVDSTLDRARKGLPAEPSTARDILDRISSIEHNILDQRGQGDLFGGNALVAKDKVQFQKMLDSRAKSEGALNQKFPVWQQRLQENIAKLASHIDTLSGEPQRIMDRLEAIKGRTDPRAIESVVKMAEQKRDEAMAEMSKLHDLHTVLKSINQPSLEGKRSELVRQIGKVNDAAAEMQRAIKKAQAETSKAEKNATPLKRRAVEEPRETGTFEQPKGPEPGTEVTRLKQQALEQEHVPTPAEKFAADREALREQAREHIEGLRAREVDNAHDALVRAQAAGAPTKDAEARFDAALKAAPEWKRNQWNEMHPEGIMRTKSAAETVKMRREAAAASRSVKGEAIRKNLPRIGKGAPDTALRTAARSRDETYLPEPGTLPETPMPQREAQSLPGQQRAQSLATKEVSPQTPPTLRARVLKAKADQQAVAERAAAMLRSQTQARLNAEQDARAQHAAKAAEQLAAKKKSEGVAPEQAASAKGVKAEVAEMAGQDTSEHVTVVPSIDGLPPSLRKQLLEEESRSGNATKAVTVDGHTYMIADRLAPGEARGVLLHELGVHQGMDAETVSTIHDQIVKMAAGDGPDAQRAKEALALQESSTSHDTRDEAVAYFVEKAVNDGINPMAPPTGLAKLFKPIVDFVKAAMTKLGLRTDQMTPQDIVNFARAGMDRALRGEGNDREAVQYSAKPKYENDYDTRSRDIADRLLAKPTPMSKKMDDWVMGFRTHFVDSFDTHALIANKMEDQNKAQQMMYYLRFYRQANNFMAEAALGGAPTVTEQLQNGKKSWTVGIKEGASLMSTTKLLNAWKGGNHDAADAQFKTYLIAERALGTNGKGYQSVVGFLPEGADGKPVVSEGDLKHVLQQGRADPVFQAARAEYKKYSDGLIDFTVQTGVMSKALGDNLKSQGDYVSFYRLDGDRVNLVVDNERVGTIGNIKSQPYLRELLGGNSKITGFMEGALRNTNLLIDMAMRNAATKNTAETLSEIGLAKIGTGQGPDNENVIRWKAHGADKFAHLETEAMGVPSNLVAAGMGGAAVQLPAAIRIMGIPSTLLRHFIVRNPMYATRQLFRDTVSNSLLAGSDGIPVLTALKTIMGTVTGSSNAELELRRKGFSGGLTMQGTTEDRAQLLRNMSAGKWSLAGGMAKLDFMASQADAAARIQMYNTAIKNGANERDARLRALETMNFTRRGISPSIAVLNHLIPFMNAHLQGIDVLYRALKGDVPPEIRGEIQRKLVTRGLMMAGATMAYSAAMQDNDAYKNASPEDKYNNWFVPIAGMSEPLRVPIPFEAGHIFKILPEALFNMTAGDGDGHAVAQGLWSMVKSTNPLGIPQAAKPIVEGLLNREFQSGRDIEDKRMQGLMPSERYGSGTTEVAKAIGGNYELAGHELGVSPAMVEHYVRGYTGTLGMAIMGMADGLIGTPAERPTRKLNETPIFGPMFVNPDASGAVGAAYDYINRYEQAKGTLDKMVKEGRGDDARAFIARYSEEIGRAPAAQQFKAQLGKLTQMEQMVRTHPTMSADEKRAMIDKIQAAKIQTARATREALQ